MHELSLAGSILRLVEQAAARERFARVTTLHLEAGRLAGVEVQALRFALQAVAPGTCLEGAVVEVDEPLAEGRCDDCGASFAVEARAWHERYWDARTVLLGWLPDQIFDGTGTEVQ